MRDAEKRHARAGPAAASAGGRRVTLTDRVSATEVGARAFRSDIQGLRAVAVGLVLLYHAGVPFISGGYVGVDVFFVISGFLISSHLLDSIETHGGVRFAEFYARRIRRILPASVAVAVATAIAAVIAVPPLALERVLKDALATILYVPNVWFAIQNTDYLADHSPSPYQHYWSLGVEEQFYMLWPLLIVGTSLLVRRRRALLIAAISAFALCSLGLGIVLTTINQPYAFFLLPTRAWELLLGALVAALLLRRRLALPQWLAAVGGWVGLALILASALTYDDRTAFPGIAALAPAVGTALVILVGAVPTGAGPRGLLSIRPLQFIGLISYSLYLVHWPLLVLPQAAVGDQHPLGLIAQISLGIVLALPLAWLLFRFVEAPLRSPAWLTRRRPRVTVLGALAITVVIAMSLAVTISWSSSREIPAGPPVQAAPSAPLVPPHATRSLPSNLKPQLDEVAGDLPKLYRDGCHHDFDREDVQKCRYGAEDPAAVIALFGDSHSAQWLPALSDWVGSSPSVAIDTYTKSSCPSADLTVLNKDVRYASCDRWRDAVFEALESSPPDIVVISNYSAYDLPGVSAEERDAVWGDGVESTVRRLEAAGSEVMVIADTPRFDSPPPTCVSGTPEDVTECAGVRTEVLDADFTEIEQDSTRRAGGTAVDLSDYICDDDVCPVIVDDLLVYRDVNHLTTPFVSYLAPALRPALNGLLSAEGPAAP